MPFYSNSKMELAVARFRQIKNHIDNKNQKIKKVIKYEVNYETNQKKEKFRTDRKLKYFENKRLLESKNTEKTKTSLSAI